MAIYLMMVRQGQCEQCLETFILDGLDIPEKCPICEAPNWQWGVEPRASQYIRQGRNTTTEVKNKGVTSLKRQAQGQAQWRRFKPKPEEEKHEGENA